MPLLLSMDVAALLLLGGLIKALPQPAGRPLAVALCGVGMLLCLPPLFAATPLTVIGLPVGPPGLSLHLGLDPLAALFLVIVFLAGTAITAFRGTASPPAQPAHLRKNVLGVAGAALSLLAADGVMLTIGLAVMCAAAWFPQPGRRAALASLIPLLLLGAVCLLAPPGFAPRFDTIRAAPADAGNATAAAVMTIAALAALGWSGSGDRSGTRDALTAGMLLPVGCYLLLRVSADLGGEATPEWIGFVLLLAGGAVAVTDGWRAASHPDIDGSVACLARRQAGLVMSGIGLALVARAADLPEAASFGFDAALLSVIGMSICCVPASLAAAAIGARAGIWRLSSLGGLVHAMPATSSALAAALLGLCALPPGLGFASLWLMFESILSAPRTGGLLFQLPLALIGAAMALSAAVTTAAVVRLIGIALLGRPRIPLSAGAREIEPSSRTALLVLSGLSMIAGLLPGPLLWLLAGPTIHALTGVVPATRTGLALLSPPVAAAGYLALPVFALLASTTGAVALAMRWPRREGKAIGPWADGMDPPVGLPFGEPEAQSAGEGFLPTPSIALPLPRAWRVPAFPSPRAPSATQAMWLLLAAFGLLLLALAVIG